MSTFSSGSGGWNSEFSFRSSPSSMMYAWTSPDLTAAFLRAMNSRRSPSGTSRYTILNGTPCSLKKLRS